MQNSNVVKLQKKTFNLKNCKTRNKYCEVRGKNVDEYLLPLDLVGQDEKSQNRDTDSPPKAVTKLDGQICTSPQGLKNGICVEHSDGDKPFKVRWGNTRFRAVTQINERDSNNVIANMLSGYIWASLYQEKQSELRRLQAKENNIHDYATHANAHDNIRSMKDIIADGHLNYDGKNYQDCDDDEKRERVKKEVLRTMPHFSGGKFKGFWNKFRKSTSSSFQTKTYDTKQMQDYFIKHNPFGIKKMSEKIDSSGKGYNFQVKNEVIRFHFVFGPVVHGAHLQSSHAARNKDNRADKVVWIVGVDVAKSSELKSTRVKFLEELRSWNDSLKSDDLFVDRVLMLPQTAPEEQATSKWAIDHKM